MPCGNLSEGSEVSFGDDAADFGFLFPRASERRVLLIVGVCKTSSHLHIF